MSVNIDSDRFVISATVLITWYQHEFTDMQGFLNKFIYKKTHDINVQYTTAI